ncbi:unnamed protein product [Closterium sp. NIES-65]|nr:unnamed protein product [Closterium sp. NIES-65]
MERDGSAGKAEPFHQAGAREQSGAGAAARTGAQQGARGSHSGAWAGQPGEWAREAGAGWDGDWLGEARRRAGPWEGRPLAVVSLFDGCGAIWQALHDCGIPFTGVSSEIVSAEPLGVLLRVLHAGCAARWVYSVFSSLLIPPSLLSRLKSLVQSSHPSLSFESTQKSFPDPFAVEVQQDPFAAEVVRHRLHGPRSGLFFHLLRLIQHLSPKRLHGPRSGLFFHLLRLIQQLSPRWFLVENVASMQWMHGPIDAAADWLLSLPTPTCTLTPRSSSSTRFLVENVASMQWMDRDEISKYLGVPPICIDCADLTAQARRRLFWTNLPLPAQMPPVRCHPSTLLQSKLCDAIATEDKCGPIMKTNFRTAGKGRTNQPIMKTNYRTAGKGRTNQVICLRSHAARFFLSHEIEGIFGFPPGYTKISAARFAAIKAGRRGATGGKAGAGKGQENGTGNWESAGADCLRGEEREEEKEDVREVNSEEGVKIERGVMSEGVRRERGVKSEGGVKEVDAAVPSDPSVPPFSPVRVLNRAVFDGVREVREEEGEEAEVREVKEGEVRGVREVSACIAGGDGGKGGAEGFDVVGSDGGKWVLGVAGKACGERGKHKGVEARRWVEGKRNGVANGEREGGGGKRRRVWKGRDGGELQGAARCDAVRSGDCVDADGDEGDDGFDGYHGGAAANGASGLKSENAVKSGDVGVLKEDNAVENGHATDHEDSEDDVVEVPPSVLGDEKEEGRATAAPRDEAEAEWGQGKEGGGGGRRGETSAGEERGQEELQERDRWGLLGNSFPVECPCPPACHSPFYRFFSYLLSLSLCCYLPLRPIHPSPPYYFPLALSIINPPRLPYPPFFSPIGGSDIIPAHAAALPHAVAVISYLLTPLLSPSLRLSAPPCALPACVPPHVTRAKCALMVPGECALMVPGEVSALQGWSKLPNWYALILSVEGGRFDTESLRKPTPLCIT